MRRFVNIIITKNKLMKALLISASLFTITACDNQIDDILSDIADGEEELVCGTDTTTVNFKQIAYWGENDEDTLDDIDFTMLTHVIYSKIGVTSSGELVLPDDTEDFEDMVDAAHDAGIYAMASIGNSSDSAFNAIAASDSAMSNFIDNMEDLIDDYDLDGIDINWQFPEGDDEGDLFEDLVKEVSESLQDEDKIFSFVVDTGQDDDDTDDGVQDDVLDYADFMNVMALNTTDDDDLHSSLEDAEDAIEYWTGRCVVKNRLVLAIPVYSKGDGELDFREIVDDDDDNACVDEASNVEDEDGNNFDDINYNGIPTVNDKTEYAQSYAGGVIITSLEQDYFDSDYFSILAAVDWQVAGSANDICD